MWMLFLACPFRTLPIFPALRTRQLTPSQHEMIQCSEGHLFCLECMVAYASNLLGERNFKIVCMDQSGCSQPFPESELKRFLTPNLLSLYWKVRQAKEVEMAALDGLEECSQCEYKAVMDNRWERVFMCQTKECGAVTCRDCKKPVRSFFTDFDRG